MVKLSVFVSRQAADLVLAELLEVSPNGCEQIDHAGEVEYVLYGAPGELPTLPQLKALIGGVLVRVESVEIADDWHERWKEFHRPLTISQRLHVRSPWHPPANGDLIDIVIDPGRAFGTGAHATTQLCLELLSECEPKGQLLDLGCGSGVLAIAACKLGFSAVSGLDNDPICITATAENAARNNVHVAVDQHDLLRGGPVPCAPTVVANLLRPLLLEVAATGFAGEPPKHAIFSGLLIDEADEITAAFIQHGLVLRQRLELDGWCALLLEAAS